MRAMYLLPLYLCLLAGAHAGGDEIACLTCYHADTSGLDSYPEEYNKIIDYFGHFPACLDGANSTIPTGVYDMDKQVCGVIAFEVELTMFDGSNSITFPVIHRSNYFRDQGEGPNSECESIAGNQFEEELQRFLNTGSFTAHKTKLRKMSGFFCEDGDKCNDKDCSPEDDDGNDDESEPEAPADKIKECVVCTHASGLPEEGSYNPVFQKMIDFWDVNPSCNNASGSSVSSQQYNMDTQVCGTICFDVEMETTDGTVTFSVLQRANFDRDQGEGPTSCKEIDGTSFQENMEMFFNTAPWIDHKTSLKNMNGCFCEDDDRCNDKKCP